MVRYIRLQRMLQYLMAVVLTHLYGSECGRQTLTFMTTKKTWNEARTICGMEGGHLLNDSTAQTTADVFELGTLEPWLSQAYLSSHFWIGLFCTGIVNITTGECIFSWSSDCSTLTAYSDWHHGAPTSPETKQCVYRKETGIHQNWHTSVCAVDKYYICQHDDGVPCGEEAKEGVRGKTIADQTYMTILLNDCRANCENMTCIAYAYNPTSGTCYLYIGFSLSHFNVSANLQEESGYTLYIRQCYDLAIDTNSYSNVTNNDTGVTDNCGEPPPTTTVSTATEGCQCVCTNMSISAGQLQQNIANIRTQLSVDKSGLSSTRRKLTSAHDDRTSSAGLGYLAVIFLISVVGVVVLTDLGNLVFTFNDWKTPTQKETYTIEL